MCAGRRSVSRLGVVCGVAALVTLLTAFVGGAWLYAREPVTLPNSDITTTLSFRIGLWRVCPTVRRPNATIHMPSPACSLVKYSGWEDVRHSDLGIWTPLEFAPTFIGRMRVSTLFEGASVILLLLATIFALIGHCNGDHKTLIACGLYILGGLSLGSGLVVFATVLSETFVEATSGKRSLAMAAATSTTGPSAAAQLSTPLFDYRYGWSFFVAVAAFVLAEVAALLSITAYLRRFPTVEDMVREMVPGAERKLREHQRLSSEYLVRHSGPLPTPSKYHHHHHPHHQYHHQYDPIPSTAVSTVHNRASKSDLHLSELEACDGGPLLSKTPPDVCTTSAATEKVDSLHVSGSVVVPGLLTDQELVNHRLGQSLAGQTVPIMVKNHQGKFAYTPGGGANKYGTLPHHFGGGTTVHQGFLGVSELGSSSSNSSSSHQSRSMTLQHPRTTGKKSVTIGTFQTMDTSYPPSAHGAHGTHGAHAAHGAHSAHGAHGTHPDPMKRAQALHGYPGSAV